MSSDTSLLPSENECLTLHKVPTFQVTSQTKHCPQLLLKISLLPFLRWKERGNQRTLHSFSPIHTHTLGFFSLNSHLPQHLCFLVVSPEVSLGSRNILIWVAPSHSEKNFKQVGLRITVFLLCPQANYQKEASITLHG